MEESTKPPPGQSDTPPAAPFVIVYETDFTEGNSSLTKVLIRADGYRPGLTRDEVTAAVAAFTWTKRRLDGQDVEFHVRFSPEAPNWVKSLLCNSLHTKLVGNERLYATSVWPVSV